MSNHPRSPIYFAVNDLDLNEFQKRCPGFTFLGKGVLKGFKLRFIEGKGSSYLGLRGSSDPRDRAEGILYRISKENLENLDREKGAPYSEQRFLLEIETEGKACKAWVFLSSKASERPERSYYRELRDLYRKHDLDIDTLDKAYMECRELLHS